MEKKSHSKDSVIQSEGEDVLLSKAKNLGYTKEITHVDATEILRFALDDT